MARAQSKFVLDSEDESQICNGYAKQHRHGKNHVMVQNPVAITQRLFGRRFFPATTFRFGNAESVAGQPC